MLKNKWCLLLLLSVAFAACKENDQGDDFVSGSNESVNNWIYDEMDFWYYWTDELPSKDIQNTEPDDYFYSLLSSEDRFSWIQPNYIQLLNSLQGVSKEAGYEIKLYQDSGNPNNVFGQIMYIKKGSPADNTDLQRGDVFEQINGTQLTVENYQTVLGEISEDHTLSVSRYNEELDSFESIGDISLSTIEFAENPNFLDTVYTINNKKIGYYVYNFFSPGRTNSDGSASSEYNDQMDEVFANFKSEGIQHLIVDLRFNGGGSETATLNLASLITPGINDQSIFVKREYNAAVQQLILDDPDLGEDFLNRYFTEKTQNVGSLLESPEVIILTSSNTASASESIINGILPFVDVVLIGDQTVGKNVGSISIYEQNDPDNTWGMQPIVVKSFNSLGNSDYDTGFIPDVELIDNELVIKPLGNTEELLLNEALNYISGGAITRKAKGKEAGRALTTSIKEKRSFGIYTIPNDLPELF